AGVPNPVASGGAVTLSVQASDSLGHGLIYTWSASCPAPLGNGAFSPSQTGQSPTWNAPANLTGSEQSCTLQLVADDGPGQAVSGLYGEKVAGVVHTLTITWGPGAAPNPGTPAGPAALSVIVSASLNHSITSLWQANCAGIASGGTFQPNAAAQNPSWFPPVN